MTEALSRAWYLVPAALGALIGALGMAYHRPPLPPLPPSPPPPLVAAERRLHQVEVLRCEPGQILIATCERSDVREAR